MRPRRLIDCRQVRLGRKQQRDDTHPMSLLSSRGMAPDGCLIGCLVSFLLILTCPMSLLGLKSVSGRVSPVGFPLTERCCRSKCQQSGRMMACDPRFHRTNYSLNPTLAPADCPHAPDPQVWSSRDGGKIPDRQRPPVHTCSYLTSSPTAL